MNEPAVPITQLIVTGAGGLVGACVVREARHLFPAIRVTEILSPRKGGVDLTARDACQQLLDTVVVPSPGQAAVIHCAADLAMEGAAVGLNNTSMTAHVAAWCNAIGLAFGVYVSSVSVYPPGALTTADAPPMPVNEYGRGKLAGEIIWTRELGTEKTAIVRLAGVLGWQEQPQMFWNRLLLEALAQQRSAGGQYKVGSRRNYITGPEVAECLIQTAMNRITGTHLAAGLETVTMGEFVSMLEEKSGPLSNWSGVEGAPDSVVYEPSPALSGWLKPFRFRFDQLWAQRPQTGGDPA